MVIHITPVPLNTSDANKIKKWLNDPAYFLFQSHLNAKAAIKAADAANSLVSDSIIDAKNSAEDARILTQLSEALSKMRDENEPFTTVELKPTPPL